VEPADSLIDLQGTPDRLYFLLKYGDRYEVMSTDENGHSLGRFQLPPPVTESRGRPSLVRAGPAGHFAVAVLSAHSKGIVQVFNATGSRVAEIEPDGAVIDAHFLDDHLVVVNYSRVIPVFDRTKGPLKGAGVPLDLSDPFVSAPVGKGQLAVVDMATGRCLIASSTSLIVAPFLLNSPEIAYLANSGAGGDAVIHAVAGAPDGDLYCGLAGFKVQEGPLVAQFGSVGQLKRTFRCKLPRLESATEPPFGYLLPVRLAVTARFLYWADVKSRKVVYYRTE
jgi:hypothetical protein